jgi:glycosyltransferase involved in cell wall biosynthesis
MLGGLLRSFHRLKAPRNANLIFLIVDNDAAGSAEAAVEQFRSERTDATAVYVIEARQGIPMARNRAIQEAVALGADFLAFVDDDEEADPDWICKLFAVIADRKLDLVGGPVRCLPSYGRPQSFWTVTLMAGISARYRKKERSARRLVERGLDETIVVITNNWMIDLAWLKRVNLCFDESLRYSGGSDALFYKQARALGARSGWSTSALVYERIPASRVTFAYQFNRARNQAIASFKRRHGTISPLAVLATLSSSSLKLVGCAACIVGLPIFGGRALIQLARQSGWVTGRIQAIFRADSSLYATVDGE